jgi:Tol biopolymer transport system component
LQWFDASGKPLESVGKAEDVRSPNLSHDGRRVAISILDPDTGTTDIWVLDLMRGVSTRMTFGDSNDFLPVWSPDDSTLVYSSSGDGPGDLLLRRTSGSGHEEVLYRNADFKVPYDWSSDGQSILFQDQSPRNAWDIWMYSLRERRATALVQTPAQELDPKFSPDGRWIVYQSDESVRSGRYQIYVLSLSAGRGKWQISTEGGRSPRWSTDGKHIFYISDDSKLMNVDVAVSGDELIASVPRPLFSVTLAATPGTQYDVSRDGKRFLLNVTGESPGNPPMTIVQNWTSKLR